jgi:hypothetical protein
VELFILALQFGARRLRSPEVKIIVNCECDDTANEP